MPGLKIEKSGAEVTIMKVHLKQIPAEGTHLKGQEKTDILDLEDDQVRPLGTVEYSVDIGVSGSSLFVTGHLRVDVELECVSCLKRFVYPIRVANFSAQVELTGPELVDLTPWIREDILLALPVHPHCDWDRKTVCVGPRLKSLNVDEDFKAPNAWEALDHLNLNRRK
jgi:uncharacterized metal-binding protein YceD (DUF177 family)